MGFIPGVTGQLYKQFAVTVAVSTMFSALVALTLTPTLCILLMKPHEESNGLARPVLQGLQLRASTGSTRATARPRRCSPGARCWCMLTLGIVIFVTVGLFRRCRPASCRTRTRAPSSCRCCCPTRLRRSAPDAILAQVEPLARAIPGVDSVVGVSGFDLLSGTAASNGALVIVKLKPWGERTTPETGVRSILMQLYALGQGIPEAVVMPFNPPALPGFGSVSGFSLMLQAQLEPAARGTGAGRAGLHRRGAEAPGDRPHQHDVQRQHAELPAVRRPREGQEARRAGQRRLHHAADVPRRLPGQRLQPLRPQLQGDDAGRVGLPPGSHRHRAAVRAQPGRRHGAARHADDAGSASTGARFLQRYNLYRTAAFSGTPAPGREFRRCDPRARGSGRARRCPTATASSGRARASRRSRPATPRRSCSACRSSSSSCSSRRCTRAGPCRSPCCSRRRSASWARCSR